MNNNKKSAILQSNSEDINLFKHSGIKSDVKNKHFEQIFIELIGGLEVAKALELQRNGHNYTEIGQYLNVGTNTIKYRMKKAHKIIKKLGLEIK